MLSLTGIEGSSDSIILGMCEGCDDSFHYGGSCADDEYTIEEECILAGVQWNQGEDQYDIPPPQGYYTDISFFNHDWVGILDTSYYFNEDTNQIDTTFNICDNPEFSIDKKDFHDPINLLKWNISGFTNLTNDDDINLFWTLEELPNEKSSEVKKIYRRIVYKTHPDKLERLPNNTIKKII